jgi:hypothetical protein
MGLFLIIQTCLMNKSVVNNLFIGLAILPIFAAFYHFIGIFYKLNSSPVWRHILFIVINIVCVYGLLNRPLWFIFFFFLLLIQQLYSHGGDILWHWQHEHRIDWISVGVVILMPAIFVLLLWDRKRMSGID